MEKAVEAIEGGVAGITKLSPAEREEFRRGVKTVLDYLEGFWMGLVERQSTKINDPTVETEAKRTKTPTGALT